MSEELRKDVAYRLQACNRIDDFQVEQKLVDALCRLPADVRHFALERCFFTAIGGDEGGFFVSFRALTVGGTEGRWLVVLHSCWKGEDFASAIAHELAHLWLKHPEHDFGPEVEAHEDEAAAQVRAWGFDGIGSKSYQERPG